MIDLLAVGAGGFLGAVGRYFVSNIVACFWSGRFPLATFVVNVLGSFALGLVLVYTDPVVADLPGGVWLALGVGFWGSFTTFSTFVWEGLLLTRKKQWWPALFYVVLSFTAGLSLAWLAMSYLRLGL